MEDNKDLIKSILERGTEAKAPADLSSRVLASWKAELSKPKVYAPLIPKFVWWILGVTFCSAFVWVLNSSSSSATPSKVTGLLENFTPHFTLSIPQINPVMIMAVAVLGMMIMLNALILRHQSKTQHTF